MIAPSRAHLPLPDPSQRSASSRRGTVMRETRGAVYVEFLVAFIPIFVMLLSLIQMALLYVDHLVVQHAATIAVRAAIVVLPDEPSKYDGAALNQVADGRRSGSGDSPITALLERLGVGGGGFSIPGFGGGGGGGGGGGSASDASAIYANANSRMDAVRNAASIPLMAISPSLQQLAPQLLGRIVSIREAIGSDNPAWRAAGALLYNRAAVAVTFPTAPGADTYLNTFSDIHGPVTARVTYLAHCGVPIARQLMCDDPVSIRFGSLAEIRHIVETELGGSPSPAQVAAAVARIRFMEERRRQQQPAVSELSTAPWSLIMLATALTGQRYAISRADATLPLQGAEYAYHASSSGSSGGSP